MPIDARPVTDFEVDKYLGTWYEMLAFGEPHLTGVTLSGDSVHLFVVDTIEGLVLWASGERGVSLVLISNGASSLRHIRQEHLCQL